MRFHRGLGYLGASCSHHASGHSGTRQCVVTSLRAESMHIIYIKGTSSVLYAVSAEQEKGPDWGGRAAVFNMANNSALYLEPPVDVHGMGNSENGDGDSGIVTTRGGGVGSGRGGVLSAFTRERIPTCFDVFAGLWVNLYERSVPHAQREAQQNYLLDELQACTVRLRLRREVSFHAWRRIVVST